MSIYRSERGWQNISSSFKNITVQTALRIIDQRLPLGLFYVRIAGIYVGIDNTAGHAWAEAFANWRSCKRWLDEPSIPTVSRKEE